MKEIPNFEGKDLFVRQTGASIPTRNGNFQTSMPIMLSVPYFDKLVPEDIYNTPFYFLKHVAGVYGTIQGKPRKKNREESPMWGIGYTEDEDHEFSGIVVRPNPMLPDFLTEEEIEDF